MRILNYIFDCLYLAQCHTSFSSIDEFLFLYAWFLMLLQPIATHLRKCLFLKTLAAVIRNDKPVLVKLKEHVNSVIILTLFIWLTFLLGFLTVTLTVLSFFMYLFIFSDASICSTLASPHWEILIMWLFQLSSTFHQTQKRMPHFIE